VNTSLPLAHTARRSTRVEVR